MSEQGDSDGSYATFGEMPPLILFFSSFACILWAGVAGYIAHRVSGSALVWMPWGICLGLTALGLDCLDRGVTKFLCEPAPLERIRSLDLRTAP
jgi:hypothetical protein